MKESIYSQHLGMITEKQFQAALDRFDAGRFLKAACRSKQRRHHGDALSGPGAAIEMVVNTFYHVLKGSR